MTTTLTNTINGNITCYDNDGVEEFTSPVTIKYDYRKVYEFGYLLKEVIVTALAFEVQFATVTPLDIIENQIEEIIAKTHSVRIKIEL